MQNINLFGREFVRYYELRGLFLQPTHFSFFGLFNLQKTENVLQISTEKCFKQMCYLIGDDIWKNGEMLFMRILILEYNLEEN